MIDGKFFELGNFRFGVSPTWLFSLRLKILRSAMIDLSRCFLSLMVDWTGQSFGGQSHFAVSLVNRGVRSHRYWNRALGRCLIRSARIRPLLLIHPFLLIRPFGLIHFNYRLLAFMSDLVGL
jgi:hypothetical protein